MQENNGVGFCGMKQSLEGESEMEVTESSQQSHTRDKCFCSTSWLLLSTGDLFCHGICVFGDLDYRLR